VQQENKNGKNCRKVNEINPNEPALAVQFNAGFATVFTDQTFETPLHAICEVNKK